MAAFNQKTQSCGRDVKQENEVKSNFGLIWGAFMQHLLNRDFVCRCLSGLKLVPLRKQEKWEIPSESRIQKVLENLLEMLLIGFHQLVIEKMRF